MNECMMSALRCGDVMHLFMVISTQEMAAIYPDRIITIRGALDNLSLAEEVISKILRECYEKDAQQGMVRHLASCSTVG